MKQINLCLKFTFIFLIFKTNILSFNYIKIDPNFNTIGFNINNNITKYDIQNSPTLSYLSIPEFNRLALQNNYKKICTIGFTNIESIINKAVERETQILGTNNNVVVYHAHKRELIVLQDIYKKIYEKLNQITLNDFEFLRLPDSSFKFQNGNEFIRMYENEIRYSSFPFNIFDNNPKINKHIIATNASIFGNSLYSAGHHIGECTFKYFIKSDNITNINIIDLCKNTFPLFKLSKAFNKYKKQINNLIQLLAENESTKSGILLQIFIPKNIASILYRSNPGGTPYYNINCNHEKYALESLELYTKNTIQLLNTSFYTFYNKFNELDEIQFRLLINNTETLNPYSGIKIFRYMVETPNTKKYKSELEKLINKITQDTKIIMDTKPIIQNLCKFFQDKYWTPFIENKVMPCIKNYISQTIENLTNV
ncbi:hypothetical protein GF322_00055 [Candidatus Dependentiae bacterium]|nr:hypothetical protein [Candidatus Dependentiae bacterium]